MLIGLSLDFCKIRLCCCGLVPSAAGCNAARVDCSHWRTGAICFPTQAIQGTSASEQDWLQNSMKVLSRECSLQFRYGTILPVCSFPDLYGPLLSRILSCVLSYTIWNSTILYYIQLFEGVEYQIVLIVCIYFTQKKRIVQGRSRNIAAPPICIAALVSAIVYPILYKIYTYNY